MLPAAHRMRRRDEFLRATRSGTRAGRSRLTVHALPAPTGERPARPGPRVGFVVSRSVGSAVARNRVRRVLRHLVRDRWTAVCAAVPAGILVVRAAPSAVEAPTATLAADLDAALAKLGPGPSA